MPGGNPKLFNANCGPAGNEIKIKRALSHASGLLISAPAGRARRQDTERDIKINTVLRQTASRNSLSFGIPYALIRHAASAGRAVKSKAASAMIIIAAAALKRVRCEK